ncbi:alanine racemase [Clostridium cibarium]|uniref:Alanine racemase n=1 Tax=Clostridium cibarium TaxID=2762247 RepID=A0ABR8PR13_9CLOT|nr:alanine racemase [Clostridium cibarium]MBD7910611.1 alanine racemase [Clostridium cibarium]
MKDKIIYNLTKSIEVDKKDDLNHTIPEVNQIYINLSQLKRNFNILRSLINPDTKFMAVLKGDACGHGMIPIANELINYKCDAFGVARLSEALTLREANIEIPIMLLSPIMPSQVSWVIRYNIIPMVDNAEVVKALDKWASEKNKIVNVHVKINTGLNRYGVNPKEALNFIREIHESYSHVTVGGIYTHFQNPENDEEFTHKQIECFNNVLSQLEKQDLRPKIVHAAGTTGIIKYPEAHYNMVRCGIGLYGLEHAKGEKNYPEGINPLITLKGRIIKIRTIKAGDRGGYGNKFIAKRDSIVAVIDSGYGDGVSYGWKEVLIAGKRVSVVNYFMDGLLVDISGLEETVRIFDEAIIIGNQGCENISWLEACEHIGSYPEEQIQRMTERVPRKYFYE